MNAKRAEFQLYVASTVSGIRLMGEAESVIEVRDGGSQEISLTPRWGSSATWYRLVIFDWEDGLHEGWCSLKAQVTIDNYNLGIKPLAFFWGEPSDFYSGIARFQMPLVSNGEKAYLDGIPITGVKDPYDLQQGPLWALTARRAA